MVLAVVSAQFIWLPFSIQAAMTAVPFLLVGYEGRQVNLLERIDGKMCLACLVVFMTCWKLDKTMMTFVSAQMDDILLSPLAGICSSLVIIYCARKLEHCRPLAWVGRNSLTCLCVHLFEMETMKSWFGLMLARLSIQDWELTRFCIKLLFILTVAAVLDHAKRSFRRKSFTLSETENGRDLAIDITKGILILLMLVGHFAVEEKCRSIIYSFHMMAFVFFSGYFFHPESCGKFCQSVGKLIRSFGIPYAVFSVLYVAGGGITGELHFWECPSRSDCSRRPSPWGRYTSSLCCFSWD